MTEILLITTGVLTTLLAGVFFGYAVSVNGGLRRLNDQSYVQAMQHINVVILNPLFMLTFMGPVILLPLTTWLTWSSGSARSLLLVAASTLYIVGVFGVTAAGNVPFNDRLAKADASQPTDASDARKQFEGPWNRLHAIRTVVGVIVAILIFAACVA